MDKDSSGTFGFDELRSGLNEMNFGTAVVIGEGDRLPVRTKSVAASNCVDTGAALRYRLESERNVSRERREGERERDFSGGF